MGGAWPTRAILACSALLVCAAPAHAATQIGMTATSDPNNCVPNSEWLQKDVGTTPGFTPSYDVPALGGVITSWSTLPASGTGLGAQLKVYRATSDPATWTVVGASASKTLTGDTLNTFNTRIPVAAGDRIGIRTGSFGGGPCDFPYVAMDPNQLGPGYDIWFFQSMSDPTFNPPPGSDVTFVDDTTEELVNVAAVVEPDADGDGFGDETQDHCPGVAGSNNGCPPPAPGPTPTEPQMPLAPQLHVTAAAKHTQRVLKQHGIVLIVRPNVASTVSATATVNLPNGRARLLRFKRASKKVAANAKATLKLALTKAQLKGLKRALTHHKLTAKAVVTTSASGQKASVKRFSIRLRS
jgi:hypothetical protein